MVVQAKEIKKLKIALVVNEFFCDEYPPLGGFGFAAMNFANFFNSHDHYNVEVIVLLPPYRGQGVTPKELHGTRVVQVTNGLCNIPRIRAQLKPEQIDLLISVDYYPNYFERLMALPRTPWIHWARDPHSPENWNLILTLQSTEYPCEYKEASRFRCKNYLKLQILRRLMNRCFCCGIQEPWLAERVNAGFPLVGNSYFRLVNRIDIPAVRAHKKSHPKILFIGRLLPVKRPWVYFEIAKRMPELEFLVVGEMDKRHHLEQIVAEAVDIPNLRMLGKKTGHELDEIFEQAWLLVNTSIHEGMPQSILQALSHGVPVVSSLDYAGTIDAFGVSVGLTKGDGMQEVESFCHTINDLIHDHDRRIKLGEAGREFVKENYSGDAFLNQFREIAEKVGLDLRRYHLKSGEY